MKNKILVGLIVFILSISMLGFQVSSVFAYQSELHPEKTLNAALPYFENVVLITWDGTNAKALEELIADGTLVNTKRVDDIGYRQTVRINSHRTSTDPGLACIESGYGEEINNISFNMFGSGSPLESIPDNYTIAERLKENFGSSVKTAFVFAWGTGDVNFDYIQQVPTRDSIYDNMKPELDYMYASENLSWLPDDPDSIAAAFHGYDEDLDVYSSPVLRAEFLGNRSVELLSNVISDRFYLRIHLTEPDQAGHGYGVRDEYGEITPEYRQSLIDCDLVAGKLLDEIEGAGIMDETLFIIATDHGMFHQSHDSGPWPGTSDEISSMTYIISNSSLRSQYDIPVHQRDLAPTILASMGVDLSSITPAYDGGEQTGIPFWDLVDNTDPFIRDASLNYLGSPYELITPATEIIDIFNISLGVHDWDNVLAGELEIDGLTFYSVGSKWSNVWFSNIDLTPLDDGNKTFHFTVTDQFGNLATYDIDAIVNLHEETTTTTTETSIAIWLSISSLLVVGTIFVKKQRR